LVTGGAGFIGSAFVRLALAAVPDVWIVNVDALTYSGRKENLEELAACDRHRFVHASICDASAMDAVMEGVESVIHFAAESHVDRSIADSRPFIETNIAGTQVLLDAARCHKIQRFLHISTDEVYGSLGESGQFTESSPLQPNSPYAASKAAAEHMVRAAVHTHGLPALITRASNNYGPRQFPEKLIPLVIGNALEDAPIPVYGTGKNVRNWIHVEDHCRGLLAALEHGQTGAVYNLGGRDELDNLNLIRTILRLVGKPESLIQFVPDRPGHDFRYSLDSSHAMRKLEWAPRIPLEDGLAATIRWYREHQEWVAAVRDQHYRAYYDRQYGKDSGGISEISRTGSLCE
jgi:dTDP-glucose 4,6-dehydratase